MTPKTTRSAGQRRAAGSPPEGLAKTPTGIGGIDQITGGGLPRGRPTLICGATGCGKTLFAMEFLVRGASQFDEPGVFVAFEETADELRDNVRSLGFDLDHMVRSKQLIVDHVRVERSEQIADLQDQLRTITVDLESATGKRRRREQRVGGDRRAMSVNRHAPGPNGARSGK